MCPKVWPLMYVVNVINCLKSNYYLYSFGWIWLDNIFFFTPWAVPLIPPFVNRRLTSETSRLSYHKHFSLPLYSVPKHSTEVYIFHLQLRVCVWSVGSASHLCTRLWWVGSVNGSRFTGEEMSCVNSHLTSPLPYPLPYPCKDTICVKSTKFSCAKYFWPAKSRFAVSHKVTKVKKVTYTRHVFVALFHIYMLAVTLNKLYSTKVKKKKKSLVKV